jgi:hypothetical protein
LNTKLFTSPKWVDILRYPSQVLRLPDIYPMARGFTYQFTVKSVGGSQFYWWRKQEYPDKTTDLPQTLSHNVVLPERDSN